MIIMRTLLLWPLICLCAWSSQNSDESSLWEYNFFISLGSYTEYVGNVQIDSEGTSRRFDFAPAISAGVALPISQSWYFAPEFMLVWPRDQEEQKVLLNAFDNSANVTKTIYALRGDFIYAANHDISFRLGASVFYTNLSGKGGTMALDNGGEVVNFFVPSESRTAVTSSLDIGVELHFSDQWSIRPQAYIISAFDSQRTQVSYTLNLTYHFPGAIKGVQRWF